MTEPVADHPAGRAVCPRCERALVSCLCGLLPRVPLVNDVELLVLQHPNEAREAKGTAPLLRLGLASCEVRVGERFEPPMPRPGRQDWLLYPADSGTAPVSAPTGSPSALRLIILDATWRKSRRMLAENAWLQALPRLALETAAASQYAALRRARRAGQLATLEAALLALEQLETSEGLHTERYAPLWQAFGRFVAAALARRGESS